MRWVRGRVGFRLEFRFEVEEDLVSEVLGDCCWAGGVLSELPGCRGCLLGALEASGCLVCGCSFGFGRGFVDEGEGQVGGGGGGHRGGLGREGNGGFG